MDLVTSHPIVDDVLATWGAALGPERAAYGNHAYRVLNVTARLAAGPVTDALAVASVFHDLGIWSDGTFDYLPPSIVRARAWLDAHPGHADAGLVTAIIDNHHRLGRVREQPALVEHFRKADLVDVSRGLVRAGLDRRYLRELVGALPYAGFHGVLLRTGLSWLVRHPLRPLPMMRLGPAPRQLP